MIKARHTRLHYHFFRGYIRLQFKRHFRDVRLIHDDIQLNGSGMMIGNHFSWWDGFISFWINEQLWKKKFFIMMLEEQLKDRMFLSKAGAFSIDPGSKSAVSSLRYAIDVLDGDNQLLCMYPQGKIETMHLKERQFMSGVETILSRVDHKIGLIYYVALVDYFSEPKPVLTIYLKQESDPGVTADQNQGSYNQFYQECIKRQVEN